MLEKILEYQKIDGEIFTCENELTKSVDREKALEIQQVMKSQHSKLIALEENAKRANEAYTIASKKYDEFKVKLTELEKQLENADESKIALYEKTYKDFLTVSASLEREIATIYTQVQQISKEYEEIIRKSKTDREKFDKYSLAYKKLKSEKEPKIEELKTKLSAMTKSINATLLSMYNQKREGHLFPVFVPLNMNKCSGCRMEISASKLAEMNKHDFGVIECENCGRYIYTK